MALVVESISTVALDGVNGVTTTSIPKPTGTVEGDLLVAFMPQRFATGSFTALSQTIDGFTNATNASQNNSGSLPDASMQIAYKIAGASEPANYTMNAISTDNPRIVQMFRISGWTIGNPIFSSFTIGGSHDGANTVYSTATLDLVRPTPSLVLVGVAHASNDIAASQVSISEFTLTTSGSNPTWTTTSEVEARNAGNIDNVVFQMVYANDSDTSNVTQFSLRIIVTNVGDPEGFLVLGVILQEPTDVTSDLQHFAIPPTIENVTASQVNVSVNIEPTTVIPSIEAVSTNTIRNTVWTNEQKPTTTWTNQSKP